MANEHRRAPAPDAPQSADSPPPAPVRAAGALDALTQREREVLVLIAAGRNTKEIALILGIAEKTATHYKERMKMKLGIARTAGLILFAVREHLIQP